MFGHQNVSRNPLRSLGSRLLIAGLFIFVCVYSLYQSSAANTVIEEKDAEVSKCRQTQESLSAQLQVVFEHKSRVEKSLKREKEERIVDKERCQQDVAEKSAEMSKKTNECESKLKELSDKEKGNEDKQANMQRNYENLQQQMNELKDEKLKAEMKHDEELMKYRGEITQVETQYKNLAKEMESLREENSELKKKVAQCQKVETDISQQSVSLMTNSDRIAPKPPGTDVVAVQKRDAMEEKKMTESSTTADSSGALSNSFTTTTNQSLNIVADKEGAEGLAQMPLPNDEKSIRKSQAHLDDTGRESEVAQAEQVAVPKILSHNERASVDAAGFDSALSFQPHESTGNFSNVNATSVTSMSSTKSPVAKVDHIGLNNDINVDQVAPPVLKKGQLSDQEIQPEDNQIIRRGEEEKPEDTGNKPQMEEDEENHREIDKDGYEIPEK